MKISKKVLYGTLLATLVMTAPFAAKAYAWGHGSYGGYHNGYGGYGMNQAIPLEKQQSFASLMRQHQDKMRPLQEQIWTKQTALSALSGNAKVEPKEITALVNELSSLHNQANAENKAFADRVKKETGFDLPYGPYTGMGGMGYQHWGRGGHRGWGHGGGHW